MKKNILFFLFFLICQFLSAQIDYPLAFQEKLKAGQLHFMAPVEAKYKNILLFSNDYMNVDLAIKSRKKKLEIRYAIEPLEIDNPIANIPQVLAMKTLANVASNRQDVVVTIHSIDSKTLEKFRADWGISAFFTPKLGFSSREHCKMVALHANGKANVYIFFLFDQPTDELENRLFSVQFKNEAEMQ